MAPATKDGEDHTGRKCIALGASYGIGRAIADLLSSRGAHVVYMSRSQDRLDAAISGKDNCHAVVVDATEESSIKSGMEKAVTYLGESVDFVCYCPGYFGADSYGSFEALFDSGNFDSGWEGSFNLHLKGMMSCFRYIRKHLLESPKGGCFIGLSSVAGSMGHPGAAIYAICKAAVDMAIRQLALEYAPRGLRVFSVAPGLIHTPAIEGLGADTGEFLKRVGDSHAKKRPGQPSEVAELVAFLCSERASFMTGGPIFVDGGCMLRSSLGNAIRPFFMKEEQDKKGPLKT